MKLRYTRCLAYNLKFRGERGVDKPSPASNLHCNDLIYNVVIVYFTFQTFQMLRTSGACGQLQKIVL